MNVELFDITVDLILVARIIALCFFLYVAWRLSILQAKIRHIETLTEHNFSEMQIRLADAVGVAGESVTRDKRRSHRKAE